MQLKTSLRYGLVIGWTLLGLIPFLAGQERGAAPPVPRMDVIRCDLEVTLLADTHELKAAATIAFHPLETVNHLVFELNENLFVLKVLDSDGVELEFRQNEVGRELLLVRFTEPLEPGLERTLRVEYEGGFDRDRFSRIFSRDLSSAYIGMEGTHLMYASKWFPVNRFLSDAAVGTLTVTAPLGMTVVGPGERVSVVTQGMTETFVWRSNTPILPGSILAGHYFLRNVEAGDFVIECFAHEDSLDAIQKSAQEAGKILAYFTRTFGPAAAGNRIRLVEVEEKQSRHHGMAGVVFITRRELTQPELPVRELARRIAYQWWQETVGIQNTSDLWLIEGLAYYSAAEYVGNAGGADALRQEIDALAVLALKHEKKAAVRSGLELGYRSDAYESVVAGKGAWIVNMLRGLTGPEAFVRLLREYAEGGVAAGGGTRAIFQQLAEKHYGKDLGWFFSQWIDASGIPELETDYVLLKTASGFRVSGSVKQERDLFRMPVDIAVVSGDRETVNTVDLVGRSTAFEINVASLPDRVVIDPRNRILRDSRDLKTAVQISLGDGMKQDENFVEAIRAYEEAIKLSPQKSLAHFRLAEVFYEQFNLQSSANAFRAALNGDKDPKWIEVWCYIYLGKIYDILGQRQRAMAEYTKALNTNDDTFGAQMEAARWLTTPFVRERTVMDSPEE